jgi:hypothetical protein
VKKLIIHKTILAIILGFNRQLLCIRIINQFNTLSSTFCRFTRRPRQFSCGSSSQIHNPLLGDKGDYGAGLSYRPASLSDVPIRQPYAIVNFKPQSGTMNRASGSIFVLSCPCIQRDSFQSYTYQGYNCNSVPLSLYSSFKTALKQIKTIRSN